MQDSNYPMAPPPPPPPSYVPPQYGSAPVNPYAAPAAPYGTVPGSPADAERVRRELIKHEAGIKSIGFLYLFGAVVVSLAGIGMLLAFLLGGNAEAAVADSFGMVVGMTLAMIVFAGLYYWLGIGLRRLDRRVRIVAIGLSIVGLLGFPLGTLISAYFLYLLASEKGNRVLSPEYQQIVAATPHIRYKSTAVLIVLIALLVLIAIGVLVAVFGS